MKKYISVFSLFVRSSFYKVIGILILMTAAQTGLFYMKFKVLSVSASDSSAFAYAENIISSSGIFLCFAAALLLISAAVSLPGCEFTAKTGFTLKRLSVTEKEVFLIQAVYNTGVYFILFSVQAIAGFGLCKLYTMLAPGDIISNQTVFLAFYRTPFLHSLLPLGETALWLRNFFIIAALGFSSAHCPFIQRRKNFPAPLIASAVFCIIFFICRNPHIGNITNIFLCIAFSCAVLAAVLYSVFKKEEPDNA